MSGSDPRAKTLTRILFAGSIVLCCTGLVSPPVALALGLALGFSFALIAYYLVWKYLVGFYNEVLGIA